MHMRVFKKTVLNKSSGVKFEHLRIFLSGHPAIMGQMIPNGSSGSSSRNGKTKQQQSQQTSKTSITSSVRVSRSKSRNGINDKNRVSRDRSGMIRTRGGISRENIFAPRLVHTMSLTNDGIPQWLSVEMMTKNRYNCSVYFIHCTEHGRVAMTRPSMQQALWMPFTLIPQNRSWQEASLAGLLNILSGGDTDMFLALKNALTPASIKLFEVYDVQMPQTQGTVTRLLWYVRLEPAALQCAHYRCCQQTESLQWINETHLDTQSSTLDPWWGFEPLNMHRIMVVNGANNFARNKWPGASFEECSLETAFQYLPRKPPANNEEQLLVSTNMTEKDIERLYLDFLNHCFPCTSMTLHSFKVYMTKIRLTYADERMEHFFRAFNYRNNGHITFPEFLMGLACIDNSSQHNETRAKFIVRYYDVHKRGYLTEDDIRIMIQDMLTMSSSSSSSSTPVTPAVVEQKLAQVLAELEMHPDPSASVSAEGSVSASRRIINCRKLLIAIGTHKFRGTSRLCRLRGSILSAIMNANLRRSARNQARTNGHIGADAVGSANYGHLLEKPYTGICIGCKTKCAAIIDDRLVKLNADGFVVGQTKMAKLAPPAPLAINVSAGVSRKVRREKSRPNQGGSSGGRGGGSASRNVPKRRTHRNPKHLKPKKDDKKVNNNNNNRNNTNASTSTESGGNLSNEDISLQGSISSVSLDHQQSTNDGGGGGSENEVVVVLARALISNIRQFAACKGTTQQPNGLFTGSKSDRHIFLDHMEMIERHVTPLLRATRCAPVTSPAFVIGDIHGNLADLLSLEAALWKRVPVIGPNLIFLGDMVDRGKWSVECVTYLLCLKVIMPQKVTLLRGNHEVRKLQLHYTYRKECFAKYGYEEGGRMWELTNRIFDSLPLCAIIDEQIYCAHGGIPRATINLRDVSALPEVIEDPEQSCPIAWEILWSDPLHQQLFVEMARFTGIDPMRCHGYLSNMKRGTAWAFNEEALDRFLSVNGLSHVVRAHEVQNNGFFFHFRKKCATIFSCSHYCGNNNECAVLLVDRDVIRVVRIDTTNNQSATD